MPDGIIRGPSHYGLFGGFRENSLFLLDIASVTNVRRIKSQSVRAIDPVTNKSLPDKDTVATLTVDIKTFSGDQEFVNVPVLSPSSCIEGTGMFSIPQIGDLCLVGFIGKGQPYILGFYMPPEETGTSINKMPVALQSGEIAIMAPISTSISGMFLLQGGVIRSQAGPIVRWQMTPAGDTLSGRCRNFSLSSSASIFEMRERDESDRGTYWRERIQRQASNLVKDAAFIETQRGAISAGELFPPFSPNPFPGTILSQTRINNKTFIGSDDKGSVFLDVQDPDAKVDIKSEAPVSAQIKKPTIITLDDELTIPVRKKVRIDVGTNQVVVVLDPDSPEAKITVGSTSLTIKNDSVTINATGNVNVTAPAVSLAEGAQGVALGDNLVTYLTQLVSLLQSHQHPLLPTRALPTETVLPTPSAFSIPSTAVKAS